MLASVADQIPKTQKYAIENNVNWYAESIHPYHNRYDTFRSYIYVIAYLGTCLRKIPNLQSSWQWIRNGYPYPSLVLPMFHFSELPNLLSQ